jgi:DMSO/TMAO reductase YedYZ molybdopterin-dependent catalytic subunit
MCLYAPEFCSRYKSLWRSESCTSSPNRDYFDYYQRVSCKEPFVKKVQSFRAIPLKTLFDLAGIKGSDKVATTALNDYVYRNTALNFISANGYLAISRSGKPIGYDEGGPIRIIFPDTSKWAKSLDPWNWALKSMSVK